MQWVFAAVLAGIVPGSAVGDRCGAAMVQLDMDVIESTGAIRQTGTSSVVAQCTDCGLSFVNGPADETRALRFAYAGQERLDLTPANQHNYPLGDLTIAFWVRVQRPQGSGATILDIDWSASGSIGGNAGYAITFNRGRGLTPRRLNFIIGRCDNQQGRSDGFLMQSNRDIALNTWTQVTVTRASGVVTIFFDNENVGQFGQGATCTGTISTNNGGYEDHSCSIGHFQRAGLGAWDPTASTRVKDVEISQFRLHDHAVNASVRAILAEGSCAAPLTTVTATTQTTTTNTLIQGLHRRVGEIEAESVAEALNLSQAEISANSGRLDTLQAQMAQMLRELSSARAELTATTSSLRTAEGQNEIMRDTIGQLQTQLLGVVSSINDTAVPAVPAVPASCSGARGPQCLPSIKAVGNDVEVRACCGTVTVQAAACTVDPCETQRQLAEIKRRIGLV